MRNRFWRLAAIAVASGIGSAVVTAVTTIIMSKSTPPNSDAEKDDADGGSKKPGGSSAAAGQEGLIGRVAKFAHDLRAQLEQLPETLSLPKPPPVLDSFSLEGVVRHIQAGNASKIIVMTGAGISTSAGIPDFRSPGTGLYENLKEYDLPHPQAIFEIGFFRTNPEPFFKLAKSLFPEKLKPSPCHYFLRLLHEKGMLLRTYTQNIDALEHVAGIPADRIVEAHGTFSTSHCTVCNEKYDLDWMQKKVATSLVPRCEKCEAVVKPDVVFFGEALPMRFFGLVPQDFSDCDLLLIMGTSLIVEPFASLTGRVGSRVPRLLINRDKAGKCDPLMARLGFGSGLEYDERNNYRDVFWQGSCDDGCIKFAELLGWGDELKELIKREWSKIDAKHNSGAADEKKTQESGSSADSGSKI